MQDLTLKEKSYTTFQVAEICDVYPSTVIRWVQQEKIKAYKTPGGHRRILRPDLVAFLKKYKLPIPAGLSEQRKFVLIVEDDKAVSRLISSALSRASASLQVEAMSNGISALVFMGKKRPDLLILDVVMPVIDGGRVLSSLRADPLTRGIKVIAMTGKRLSPEKLAFMKHHANAFFAKPFDMRAFLDKSLSLLGLEAPKKMHHGR